MAVALIMTVIVSIMMIGLGSYVLFPVMNIIEDSPMYEDLPQEYQIKLDQNMVLIGSLPVLLFAVVIIWAFLRAGKNDQFSY